MFNSSARRAAIEALKKAVAKHEAVRDKTTHASQRLFEQRRRAADEVIAKAETYVNRLANSPKEFDKTVAEYRFAADRFDRHVKGLEAEAAKTAKAGSTTGTVGAAAGVGVAALGPSAAMAIATTFGTASTGTAISTLSGAAATKAALAWLGGGALAASGGGMAAGSTLLALAGPVGWGIAGTAAVGSALFLRSRNRRYAEEATKNLVKVEGEIRRLRAAIREIKGLRQQIGEHADGSVAGLEWLAKHAPMDYLEFQSEQKERLAALINHIRSLGKLLTDQVAL
ncbi:MAG: hypothetical protein OXF68_02575 [Gammaproteobacteria bacterium]|nr:hypothetical protein [Gammaproteobacteria bacterium]